MSKLITGIHHVTAIAGGAQKKFGILRWRIRASFSKKNGQL